MNTSDVIVVRIYLTESSKLVHSVLEYLTKQAKIRGVSMFRAISGFGETGLHTSSLLDLSLDLPVAIEFFDHKEKVDAALNHLGTIVKPEHIVFWNAKANEL